MKILSRPKKNAEEYGRWAVNPYVGCSNQCEYCFLRKGPSGKYLGQDHPVLKKGVVNEEHACLVAMTEILENEEQIKKDGGLFFSFTTDPLLPDTHDACLTIAAWAINHGITVMMLTKCASFYTDGDSEFPSFHDLPFIDCRRQNMRYIWAPNAYLAKPDLQCIAIGWTLTGHDELEPKASPNAEHIKAMDRLAASGFKTWASIEPVIDFVSSFDMIRQALDAGCQHFKIGLMTRGTKVCRSGFTLGGKTFEPYDPARCLAFVQDVMQATRDRATVYWKQSFRDFLRPVGSKRPKAERIGGTGKHRLFSDDELHKIFDDYPNAVGKDWSMFSK